MIVNVLSGYEYNLRNSTYFGILLLFVVVLDYYFSICGDRRLLFLSTGQDGGQTIFDFLNTNQSIHGKN